MLFALHRIKKINFLLEIKQAFIMKITSWLGHRAREAGLYIESLFQLQTDRTAIFCVDGPRGGFASGLRGHLIADQLKKWGWRVIVIPHQLELVQRQRIIKREKPDILFLQKTRHPLNHPSFILNHYVFLI